MKNKSTNCSKLLIVMILVILLSGTVLAGILFGSVRLAPADIVKCFTGKDRTSTAYILITTVRIPRVLGGVFAGIGLACAGVILQGVMNNSLASPNTIGVNSGAGFAVMLGMLIFPDNQVSGAGMAFAGALTATLFIFGLAYLADSSRTTIVLAGITVSSFLNAGINMIKLLDTDISMNLTSFLIGSLAGLTISRIWIPVCGIAVAFAGAWLMTGALNLLNLGDDIARSLGLRVGLTRFILLVISSILAGCVVSYAGLLSFVGLIIPHICRQLFGNDARFLIPCSALLGAIFVLLCDLMGRMLFAPFELPAGIPMALTGGPFFLYLLLRRRGGRRINA